MAHFDKDVIPQIEAVYATLSPTEKVVADFFIHNRRRMDFGAPNIADILHVSLASLSRFAKKIGFAGYREFIYKYKEDLREDTAQTVPDQWSMQALSSYQELLDKSYALVNERQINALSDMLSTYQRIYVYGRGSSGLAAQEMQLRFMRIGSIITAITDSDVMMMNSVLLDDTCLVIAISISGKTPAVIKALRKAKESGASQRHHRTDGERPREPVRSDEGGTAHQRKREHRRRAQAAGEPYRRRPAHRPAGCGPYPRGNRGTVSCAIRGKGVKS